MPKILNLFRFHLIQSIKKFQQKRTDSTDNLRGGKCLTSAVYKYWSCNLLRRKHFKSLILRLSIPELQIKEKNLIPKYEFVLNAKLTS